MADEDLPFEVTLTPDSDVTDFDFDFDFDAPFNDLSKACLSEGVISSEPFE